MKFKGEVKLKSGATFGGLVAYDGESDAVAVWRADGTIVAFDAYNIDYVIIEESVE